MRIHQSQRPLPPLQCGEVSKVYQGKINDDNNMGLVRYVLALAVLIAHFNYCNGTDVHFPVSSYHAVGGFFALSGFLIYGSYARSRSTWSFIKRRTRKILPPYVFIVLACAFLLIFTVSADEKSSYFSLGWLKYLFANLSFLNFLAPSIPGVFDGEPINGSLWTVKIEWSLYLTVPLLFITIKKFRKINVVFLTILIYLLSGTYRLIFFYLYETTGQEIFNILYRQFFGQLCYFYAGVLAYLLFPYFTKFKYIILGIALSLFLARKYIPWFQFFIEPVAVTSIVLAVSFCGEIFKIFNKNNFSYEIYLFHMPIFMLFSHYQSNLGLNETANFIVSVAVIMLLAAACWFFIDKKILEQGKKSLETRMN